MTTEHECIDCGHHWVPERIMEHGGDFAKAASAVRTSMQVAAGVAAAPAARVATTTTTAVACPHCGSTNTKEVAA